MWVMLGLWIPVGFPSPARTTWTHTNTEDSLQGFGLGLGSNFTTTRPYLEKQPERLQLHNGALSRDAQLRPKPAPGLQWALCFHPSPGLTEHQGTEKFPHADLNPSHLGTSRRAAGTRLAEPAPAQAKGTGLHLPSADVRACCHQEGMQCGVLAIPPRLHSGEDQ